MERVLIKGGAGGDRDVAGEHNTCWPVGSPGTLTNPPGQEVSSLFGAETPSLQHR